MTVRTRLLAADLPYEEDIRVFTAVSRPVDILKALYFCIENEEGFFGLTEIRANIAFLTHIPEDEVPSVIRRLVEALDWTQPLRDLYAGLQLSAADHPPIARAAVEGALVDGLAKEEGVTAAEFLGGVWQDSVKTSNCLFYSSDEVFDRLAERYIREGFTDLKVRIAIEDDFEHDLARLRRVRERYGESIRLAVDANGAWPLNIALERLKALEPLSLAYVEQPTTIDNWEAFACAGKGTDIPLMADENLKTDADFETLARLGRPFLAHLKIVKMGGPRVVVEAAQRLRDAGVEAMMGQMNEGALATGLAVHCAMAIRPKFHELYGCYGLLDDPASGVTYRSGWISIPKRLGIGLDFDAAKTTTLWEVEWR
jgi:L-alanine-DL-glutamate epimerase-like enolase superfamily enzyme